MSTILLGYKPETLPAESVAEIETVAPDMRLLITEDRARIEAALDDIEIAARRFPHDLILRAPRLRWLQQWGAGADWLMRYPEVAGHDLTLTNASGVHPIQITEHILAFLLAFGRHIHHAVRAQARHEWRRPDGSDLLELAGRTLLLIGLGAIGQRTARIAGALGMRVLGVRRDPTIPADRVEAMYGPGDLVQVLPHADFVVLTVPLTDETRGIIGQAELRAMRPTAYIRVAAQ